MPESAVLTRTRLAVQTHLACITVHRPLEQISDPQQWIEAERLRSWFAGELLDVLQSER